ncbi:CDP-glycerol glycerophosphotransferase family protein [Bifidobacterium catulorum]
MMPHRGLGEEIPMKRYLVEVFRCCLLFAYRLFLLLPKHRRIICLSRESNHPPVDFRLIQRYMAINNPDYRVKILAKRLDDPVTYCIHMIRQLYYIATSRAVVLDTYAIIVSMLAGQIRIPVIQMWHALGNMKKFGYTALDDNEGRGAQTATLMRMHQGYSSVLISSKSFIDDYAAGFGIDKSRIIEAPLPRTDLLTSPAYRNSQRARIIRLFPELGRKKNIVYCPTFRRRPPSNQAAAAKSLVEAIDFERYNLIIKKHPLDTLHFDDPRVFQTYPSRMDMLFIADYVISDYSTVIYEAGLLDVPVFLYGYDWEEYSRRRSLYIDPRHDVPTLFTGDAHRLFEAIDHDEFDRDAFSAFIRRNVALPRDASCTQQVVEHILGMIHATR